MSGASWVWVAGWLPGGGAGAFARCRRTVQQRANRACERKRGWVRGEVACPAWDLSCTPSAPRPLPCTAGGAEERQRSVERATQMLLALGASPAELEEQDAAAAAAATTAAAAAEPAAAAEGGAAAAAVPAATAAGGEGEGDDMDLGEGEEGRRPPAAPAAPAAAAAGAPASEGDGALKEEGEKRPRGSRDEDEGRRDSGRERERERRRRSRSRSRCGAMGGLHPHCCCHWHSLPGLHPSPAPPTHAPTHPPRRLQGARPAPQPGRR